MTQPNTLGAPGENDTIIGVEDIMGGHNGDVIIGDAVHNLISGDPQPFVFNVPPDPPAYPPAGAHAGDDHITTRDAGPDTVDCTEGTADVHVADGLDASINCENRAVPACSDGKDNDGDGKSDAADPGCESATDESESPDPPPPAGNAPKPRITGPSKAGKVTVKKDGSLTLAKNIVICPKGNASCKVTNAVAAGKTKLGSRSYTLKAGKKGAASSKLTKKRLSQLKKRKSMKSTVTIKAALGAQTVTKKVSVTLKAPKKTKSRKR
jgi:hypothetical protein